jgi:hypothetical protein
VSCYDGIVTLGDRAVVFGGGGLGSGLDMGSSCLIMKIIAKSSVSKADRTITEIC